MSKASTIEGLRAQIDSIVASSGSFSTYEPNIENDPNNTNPGQSNTRDSRYLPGHDIVEPGRNDDASAALSKIVALVNASDKSERSIRQRLERDGFTESAINESVERARDYGFIDDMRFAEILIRSRINQSKGSSGIMRELAENGIDADSVPGWPFDYAVSHEEELERALDLLNRKPPRSKNKRDAAFRKLMQKGFPSSVSSSAARIWSEQR